MPKFKYHWKHNLLHNEGINWKMFNTELEFLIWLNRMNSSIPHGLWSYWWEGD